MKFTELEPRWVSAGDSAAPIGISFICPHCYTAKNIKPTRLAVYFDNKINEIYASTPLSSVAKPLPIWKKTGDDFENISLSPSVDASSLGHWHGFITNGEIK